MSDAERQRRRERREREREARRAARVPSDAASVASSETGSAFSIPRSVAGGGGSGRRGIPAMPGSARLPSVTPLPGGGLRTSSTPVGQMFLEVRKLWCSERAWVLYIRYLPVSTSTQQALACWLIWSSFSWAFLSSGQQALQ